MTNLILTAIGIVLVVYIWRGFSGMGWHWPGLDVNGGGGFSLPNARGMGETIACKWNGTC